MRRAISLLLSLACLPAAGCVMGNLTEGNAVAEDRLELIEPGTTTRAEILRWFGPPESFTDPGALRRLLQESEVMPEDVLDLPLADVLVFELTRVRLRGLILVLFNWIEARAASDRLVVFFDDADRVQSFAYRKGTDALD